MPLPTEPAESAAAYRCTWFPVVGVGGKAGDFQALGDILRALPPDTGMAFVLVLHFDPTPACLEELLSAASTMSVVQAADGMPVEPNHIYVGRRDACITISDGVLQIQSRPDTPKAIDFFFNSLALEYGARAIGVILSDAASDGVAGLKAIKAAGGITFAQASAKSEAAGVESDAIAALVDFVLSPKAIGGELLRIRRHPYMQSLRHENAKEERSEPFAQILARLRAATGVDLLAYKQATIRRRMLRRMALFEIEHIAGYADYLRRTPAECQALLSDILINVTGFFREPAAFDALREKVFPALFMERMSGDPVRIWVPACATGEEVYSIAIALLEYSRSNELDCRFQIFGTDLSESSLETARAGLYPASIAAEVSPEQLRRFFVKNNGGSYQISRSIRSSCVFARHDLTRDPPFSHLDLISCRNLLIYLRPALQERAIRFFHYGLNPSGFLLLGETESVGEATDLFTRVQDKGKIYFRQAIHPQSYPELRALDAKATAPDTHEEPPATRLRREADRLILTRHSPPAVLVNKDLKVLQFRGHIAEFLDCPDDEPNPNLGKMTRGWLVMEIRNLIRDASTSGKVVTSIPLPLAPHDTSRNLRLSVTPVNGLTPGNAAYLVLFERIQQPPASFPSAANAKEKKEKPNLAAAALRIRHLEAELTASRFYVQSVIEQYVATIEELKSTQEELLSSNEELQATIEELMTSKEELQSSNEELGSINEKMQRRNAELRQSNNDFNELLHSMNVPALLVGRDLRVRLMTPQAENLLGLLPSDLGRKITDFRIRINCPDLEALCTDAIETLQIKDCDIQDRDGGTWLMRLQPFRTFGNQIGGAVMMLYEANFAILTHPSGV